jgi:hypothetical protein
MNAEYGNFYSVGMPGLGTGLYATVYMVTDPEEFVKIVRQEGTYPSGAIENQWVSKAWVKSRGWKIEAFFGR